eukprot:c28332_g1_i2 orf=343-588(+)
MKNGFICPSGCFDMRDCQQEMSVRVHCLILDNGIGELSSASFSKNQPLKNSHMVKLECIQSVCFLYPCNSFGGKFSSFYGV